MIRRTLLAAVTTLMMLGSVPAVAQTFVSDTLNPDRFGPVRVILEDAATDGCWTNLGEAKTYAEDQLKRLGYTVVTEEYLSRFSITVHSQRLEIGQCWGSIQLQMYRSEGVQGLYGVLEVASKQAIFVNRANANIYVLNQIKELIDEMDMKQRDAKEGWRHSNPQPRNPRPQNIKKGHGGFIRG